MDFAKSDTYFTKIGMRDYIIFIILTAFNSPEDIGFGLYQNQQGHKKFLAAFLSARSVHGACPHQADVSVVYFFAHQRQFSGV